MTFTLPPSTPHRFLARLYGGWTGTSKIWLEPDKLLDEAPIIGTTQLILDGRFALFLYQTAVEGETQHGMFTFGYNTTLEQYETTWVDSWHNNTGIMFCIGHANETENGFKVFGSYPDPAEGPDWGWRTEVELVDSEHFIITGYNIDPEGGEARATEAKLTRVKK